MQPCSYSPAATTYPNMWVTGLETTPIGVGAWSWGDRSGYWGYGGDYNKDTNLEAYKALIDSKIGLIDTAQVRPVVGLTSLGHGASWCGLLLFLKRFLKVFTLALFKVKKKRKQRPSIFFF